MTRPCVVKLVMMILSIGYDFVSDWARIVRASFCFRSSTTREEVPSRCARARRRPTFFNPSFRALRETSVRGGGVCRQSINRVGPHHRTSSSNLIVGRRSSDVVGSVIAGVKKSL
jgi:hypothetical protein